MPKKTSNTTRRAYSDVPQNVKSIKATLRFVVPLQAPLQLEWPSNSGALLQNSSPRLTNPC